MKYLRLLIMMTLFISSCQTLPEINSALPPPMLKYANCPAPFLKEPYRLVHAIETRIAGQTQGAIIGITLVDPSTRFVSCAILTAEGMVLFEAEANPVLKVIRALPPFDSSDFAVNMIDDVKLIFLAPEGKFQTQGYLADGANICRFAGKEGDWIDVVARSQESIEINRYSACGNLLRRIKLNQNGGDIYSTIELKAKERFNYSLFMKLIEAEPLGNEWNKEKNKSGVQ